MKRVYTAFAPLSGSNGADRLAPAAAAVRLPEPLSGKPWANTPSSHGGGRLALTALSPPLTYRFASLDVGAGGSGGIGNTPTPLQTSATSWNSSR